MNNWRGVAALLWVFLVGWFLVWAGFLRQWLIWKYGPTLVEWQGPLKASTSCSHLYQYKIFHTALPHLAVRLTDILKANISQVSGRFSIAAIHIFMLPSFTSDQQISASLEEHIHKFKKQPDSRWNAACNLSGNSLPSMLRLRETEKVIQNSGRLFYGKHCKHVICSPTNKENTLNWKQGWQKKMHKTQI